MQPPPKKRRGVQLSETLVTADPLQTDPGTPQPTDLDWTLDGFPVTAFQIFGQDFEDFSQLPSSSLFPSHYDLPFPTNELCTPDDSLKLPQNEREISPETTAVSQSTSDSAAALYRDQLAGADAAQRQRQGNDAGLSSSGQSLDDAKGFISQYLGFSGGIDPFMLHHMRFQISKPRRSSSLITVESTKVVPLPFRVVILPSRFISSSILVKSTVPQIMSWRVSEFRRKPTEQS